MDIGKHRTVRVEFRVFLLLCLIFISIYQTAPAHAASLSDGQYTIEITPIPDWVETAEITESSLPASQGRRYLLLDKQVLQQEDNSPSWYLRLRIQVLTSTALEEESKVDISYQSLFQDVEIHHINVERNGTLIDKLGDAIVNFNSVETDSQNSIYTGNVQADIILKDTRVNDIIDVAYTINGINPIFGNKFFDDTQLGYTLPIENYNVRYVLDASRQYETLSFNTEHQFESTQKGNNSIFHLSMNNIQALNPDDNFPPWYDIFPAIYISEYESWEDVASWATQLFEVKEENSEQLSDLIASLKTNHEDKEAYILAALDYVQNNIRYVSLSIGENSHLPHPPNEVLENGFGDCKDKTLLFITLLHANDIKAHAALVSTLSLDSIDQRLPSPNAFDHVISRIEFEDEHYWLDPTRSYQAGNLQNRVVGDFKKALVVSDQSNELTDMKPRQAYSSVLAVKEEFHSLGFSNDVSLKIETKVKGELADYFRSIFANLSLNDIQTEYEIMQSHLYREAYSTSDLSFQDNQDINEFSVTENYRLENYWLINGPYREGDIIHAPINDFLSFPAYSRRNLDFFPGQPVQVNYELSFVVPEDKALPVDEDKINLSIDDLTYQSNTTYQPGLYTVNVLYELYNDHIETDKIREFRNAIEKIQEETHYSLTFMYPPSDEIYDDSKALIDNIENLLTEME